MSDNFKENQITVAVWMVTYNHEDYISRAVESVMNQKTNFKYKLFIGEDYSTDNTREICLKLANKYPTKIELVLQSKNVGGTINANSIYKLCCESGAKYVALCEGDDYWTDLLKIQKQVDIFEQINDLSICFHASFINKINSTKVIRPVNINENSYFKTEHIIKYGGGLIPTASMMVKSLDLQEILKPHLKSKTAGDLVLVLYLSLKGKVYYLNEAMSVYTKNNFSSLTNVKRSIIFEFKYKYYVFEILNDFNSHTKNKYWLNILRRKISLITILLYRLLYLRFFKN